MDSPQTSSDLQVVLGNCGTELWLPFSFTTQSLDAGALYQLAMRSSVNVDIARAIPLPGSLLLFGTGLMAAVASRRVRRISGVAD
tara:strand:+ start:7266 stop:7520 length:255 start_codon:yes stop_codon:yes gene_type:complete